MKKGMFALIAGVSCMLIASSVNAGSVQEENQKMVREFYEAAINRKDFGAAEKYLGPRYVQHNQRAADGKEGLKAFIGFLREKYPHAHSEITKVFTDGDFVILHVHSVREPGTPGSAVVDMFRLENGRIVEHWDVHEDIIDKPANNNGMF